MAPVYEPAEDSDLLLGMAKDVCTRRRAGRLLEVGVGSGYVLARLAEHFPDWTYSGSDLNDAAVAESCQRLSEVRNDSYHIEKGDLFTPFHAQTFSVVLFNAPYLPLEDGERYEDLSPEDWALYGGKKGYEVTLRFLRGLGDVLEIEGEAIVVVSSHTHLGIIREVISQEGFICEEEVSQGVGLFETIHALRLSFREEVREALRAGMEHPHYLAAGKHSIVLHGRYGDEPCILKIGPAAHLQKEGHFLRYLRNESFVPRMFHEGEGFVLREKVDGWLISSLFAETCSSQFLQQVLDASLIAVQRLDELGITKFEMHHPRKHIFVHTDATVTFIDFERCIFSMKPKNTTQFLQYLRSSQASLAAQGLSLDVDRLNHIAKTYKSGHHRIRIRDLLLDGE